jgi:AraC family transcriptional regulator
LPPTTDSRRDYERRIHRVMDYITARLGQDLSLEALAREAAFSPYHFHRIFTAITGEPVAAFVRRVRLERAAVDLAIHPARTVTETALRNGFDSSAVFARAFRERFGMSATAWRSQHRKECKAESKGGKASIADSRYARPWWVPKGTGQNEGMQMEVRIEQMPALRAAYVRKFGDYYVSAGQAWSVLCAWAGPRGLLTPGRLYFSVNHDDPTITPKDKLRYDACIEIDAGFAVNDRVGVVELPARQVAKARYVGPAAGILGVYKEFYGSWLPESGFVPADTPAIEVYLEDEGNRPQEDHFVMDICIPIVPA